MNHVNHEGQTPENPFGATRRSIEDQIETLIAILDSLDTDCDLEDNGDELDYSLPEARQFNASQYQNEDDEETGDFEPLLGAPERHPERGWKAREQKAIRKEHSQEKWASGRYDNGEEADDEREDENEHGGDVLDEPHDASDQGDDEFTLGWAERDSQRGIGTEEWSDYDTADGFSDVRFNGDGYHVANRLLVQAGKNRVWVSPAYGSWNDEIKMIAPGQGRIG